MTFLHNRNLLLSRLSGIILHYAGLLSLDCLDTGLAVILFYDSGSLQVPQTLLNPLPDGFLHVRGTVLPISNGSVCG